MVQLTSVYAWLRRNTQLDLLPNFQFCVRLTWIKKECVEHVSVQQGVGCSETSAARTEPAGCLVKNTLRIPAGGGGIKDIQHCSQQYNYCGRKYNKSPEKQAARGTGRYCGGGTVHAALCWWCKKQGTLPCAMKHRGRVPVKPQTLEPLFLLLAIELVEFFIALGQVHDTFNQSDDTHDARSEPAG
jgi:hypothetical protein